MGLSLGPPLGGFLTRHWGWRSIFLTQVPLALAVLALVWGKLKGEWKGETRGHFDVAGAGLYGLALATLIYGFPRLATPMGPWLTLAGLLGLGVFALWEQRVSHPILDLHLLRGNKVFAFSNLAALINYSATAAVGFLLSLCLQNVKGLFPDENVPLFLRSARGAFALFALLCTGGIFASLARGELGRPTAPGACDTLRESR